VAATQRATGHFPGLTWQKRHQFTILKVGTRVALYVGVMKFQATRLQEEKI